MFDQVSVWPPTACDFYVMSVFQFIYDRGIAQQVTKFNETLPIFIGGHVQDSISRAGYFHHEGIEFVVMFKSN